MLPSVHYRVFSLLLLFCVFAAAQDSELQSLELKGKVQLIRNGHSLHDSSKVVVWLTPLGSTPVPAAPVQRSSEILPLQ
jgi:hypothetical protein